MVTVWLLRSRAPPSCPMHSSPIGCSLFLKVPGWKFPWPHGVSPGKAKEGERGHRLGLVKAAG